MAKGKKTGGRDFEKNHGFSKGRPPLTPEVRQLQTATREELTKTFSKFLSMNRQELALVMKQDSPSNLLELAVGSILLKAINTGDAGRLGFILDRVYGKVKETSESTVTLNYDEDFDRIPLANLIEAAR